MGGGYGRRTIVACDTLAPPQVTACLIFCGQAHAASLLNAEQKGMQVQGWIQRGGGGGGAMGGSHPLLTLL